MATFIPRPRNVSRREKEAATGMPSAKHAPPTRSKRTQVTASDESVSSNVAPSHLTRSVQRHIEPSFRARKHHVPADTDSAAPTSVASQLISPGHTVLQNDSPIIPNVLRRKRSLIGDHVRRNRETAPDDGPGKLSIRIPRQNATYTSAPAPRQDLLSSRRTSISVVPPMQDILPHEILEEPHHLYSAPTPMSELSTTPSVRDGSPSIFSQISPSSTNTPATSVTSYSPQVIQSPQFGPPYPTLSPIPDSPALVHRSQTSIPRQSKRNLTQYQRSATVQGEASAKIVRPPELAHLETANTAPVTKWAPARPDRPLEGLTAQSTYVSPTTRGPCELSLHRLQGPSRPAEPVAQLKPFAQQARGSDTQDPRQMSQSQPTPSVARTRLSIKPPDRPRLIDTTVSSASATSQSRSASTPAPAVSAKSSSCFGFFHRKEKIPTATKDADDSTQARKGPTAGTGHEGYGRQASKRRSGGGTSSKRGSSGSASSLSGDDFIIRKAAPVYLRKGANGQLLQSDRNSAGFEGDRNSQMSSGSSYEIFKHSMQQADVAHLTQSPIPMREHHSASKDIDTRGSNSRGRVGSGSSNVNRSRKKSKDSKRVPTPEDDIRSPPVSRLPTPPTGSVPGPVSSLAIAGKAGASALRSFFGISRSRTKPGAEHTELRVPTSLAATEVSMNGPSTMTPSVQPGKILAHYEILDSTENTSKPYEHVEMEEIGQILEEAVLTDTEDVFDASEMMKYAANSSIIAAASSTRAKPVESAECGLTLAPELQRQHSMRSHHDVAAHTVKSLTSSPASISRSENKRQSRLPQFVNHVRNNQKSFSRPFEGSNPQPSGVVPEPLPPALGHNDPQMHRHRHFSNSNTVSIHDVSHGQAEPVIQNRTYRSPSDDASQTSAFFKIPVRKDSDISVSSSSGSLSFWCPIRPETASFPRPGSHASPDEVWQEYDEFIEKVLTPSESHPSTNSLKTTKEPDYFSEKPRNCAKTDDLKSQSSTPFPQLSGIAASGGTKLSPFAGIEKRSPDFRGQQHPALATLQPPIRPLPETPVPGVKVSSASQLIRRASVKTKKHQPEEPPIDKLNALDLREAALEVCKWMSFDQVLVSPAHDELQTARDEKILVVDGLGKEWSLFCAKNYPNTQVFDISPALYEHGPYQSTSPLPNHRHVRCSNLAVSFPFPQNTFHTVVFRFPAATSEFSLGRAISECKRVLSPGGFLEIFVMDLDLDIMGPKTRRAVKGLKERLQQSHPDISLKPTSDYVQYLLGRYGLENLNRVMIGVPVAGVISSSPDGSKDEGVVMKPPHVPKSSLAKRNEIFRALAPKVARWWYTQTYEQKLLTSDQDSKSIWSDQGLLKECRDKQAAFRLLICHAQKPILNKRKTQSL